MRMRKHFATGAALTAAAAMILTACGGGSSTTTSTDGGSKGSDGPKGTITAGVAYETTDYGPITTSALGMGANWQVLEGLYRFNMPTTPSAPRWPPVTRRRSPTPNTRSSCATARSSPTVPP